MPLFQCVLLLAIVNYEKSDEYIRNKIEPFLHAVPLLMAFGYYIFVLVMGNVNPHGISANSPSVIDPSSMPNNEVGCKES